MVYLCGFFAAAKSDTSSIIEMRTAGDAMCRRKDCDPSLIFVPWTPRAIEAIQFWEKHFPKWNRMSPFFMDFGPCASAERWGRVDASTDWGCGGWCMPSRRGFRHEWTSAERKAAMRNERESTGMLELMGAVRWIKLFADQCRGRRVLLELDNEAAVRGLESAFSPAGDLLDLIREFKTTCVEFSICVRVRHVLGVPFNAIADALSHNNLGLAQCLARQELGGALLW